MSGSRSVSLVSVCAAPAAIRRIPANRQEEMNWNRRPKVDLQLSPKLPFNVLIDRRMCASVSNYMLKPDWDSLYSYALKIAGHPAL